ncbi:hypothetical protein J4402_02465 [Candidatus Pacearchaeota archaeon]|nr:hypothetical protein [Candidatus Pacearchaeota archaeon]
MDKKLFLFGAGILFLLVMSGFASARISYDRYNSREDVKFYTCGERLEIIEISYKKPAERIQFYQTTTYADVYGKSDDSMNYGDYLIYPNQMAYQRQNHYNGYRGNSYMKMSGW